MPRKVGSTHTHTHTCAHTEEISPLNVSDNSNSNMKSGGSYFVVILCFLVTVGSVTLRRLEPHTPLGHGAQCAMAHLARQHSSLIG